jgi:hypothetical protein
MNFTVFGYGDALLFTNGKMVKMKWSRGIPFDEDLNYTKDIYQQTRFFDAETGDEIILNKGKTWVCLVWKDYESYTKYS